ncbi:MAG TPA: hypothetical protein RMF84_20165 [Polyangiaceae bacterium LLY-WYZ-14_1]|nr:hypothetical protein [Polyangiaceae bacterium LLY-WYZ-14_1]
MPRSLVVYSSLWGANRRVAEAVAEELGADLDEIQDLEPRGVLGICRGVLEALARGLPTVRFRRDPRDYDLIVLGGPVWGRSICSPLRSYLHQQRGRLPARVGCFCTYAGVGGGERAVAEMRALAEAPAAPGFVVHERDVRRGQFTSKLAPFLAALTSNPSGEARDPTTLAKPEAA